MMLIDTVINVLKRSVYFCFYYSTDIDCHKRKMYSTMCISITSKAKHLRILYQRISKSSGVPTTRKLFNFPSLRKIDLFQEPNGFSDVAQ